MLSKIGKTPQVGVVWFASIFIVAFCAIMICLGLIGSFLSLFIDAPAGTDFFERTNILADKMWPYFSSVYTSIIFLLGSIAVIAFLMVEPLEERLTIVSQYLPAWFILSLIIFLHSVFNPLIFTNIHWHWLEYVLRLLPLGAVVFIGYYIVKAVNIEMLKAHEADHKYTAEYRRNYIKEYYQELLDKESEIYRNYNRNIARWRIHLLRYFCHISNIPTKERLMKYYREPVLLHKLAQLHYSPQHQLSTEVLKTSDTEIELPSTFDINRFESDIQIHYFNQDVLKEYVYLLSTRFTNLDQQKQLQELIEVYAIDTGLTVEQQNRIETKRKWKQRQYEEKWKEVEEGLELASQERKLKAEDYMDRVRAKLTQQRASENNAQLLDELDNMRIEYNRRKMEIGHDASLSDVERKEQLRILQRAYISQIDDFGDRL